MNEETKVLRKMVWINTALIWITLLISSITLISVLVDNVYVQILAFLLLGLAGIGVWNNWSSKVKPLLG